MQAWLVNPKQLATCVEVAINPSKVPIRTQKTNSINTKRKK